MDAATRIQTVERLFDDMDKGRYEAILEAVTDDFVQEWPQSGERVRGKEACLSIFRSYPGGTPKMALRRITGGGDTYVAELDMDYGGKPVHGVSILEFRGDRIARETDYFADPFEPPAWRAQWVEPMPEMTPA